MKTTYFFAAIAAIGLVLVGCSKQEPAAQAEADAQKAADTTAAGLTEAAQAAKAAGEKAVADVSKQAKDTAAAATSKVQELIDKAKSLVAENKWQDASAVLQQLTGHTLTAEQQKWVDGLKQQIQKALAGKAAADGASAVGDVLGGKK